jgi:hypothetical protein
VAYMAMAFPILPGKEDEFRRFAKEVQGRLGEYGESCRELGETLERWYLQESPEGAMGILYMEAEDPSRAMREFAASNSPLDVWVKQQVQGITGMDMNQPPPSMPEQVFEWRA